MLESFFIYGDLPSTVEKGFYQPPLVVLSYLVASFASYTALYLAQQLVHATGPREKRLLYWGGAFAMGAGIWSMHFIGMLSYKMDMLVHYDPAITILSMLIAITFSYGVLRIVARPTLGAVPILVGGILLGLGICSMHYTGMAAMKMDGDMYYTPGLFSLSVAIAIIASAAALWIAFTLARYSNAQRYLFQIVAALIMGAAICGMHYTGMAASVFVPWANCRHSPNQDFDMLAVSTAIVTAIILFLALAIGSYKKTKTEFQLQYYMKELEASNRNLDSFVYIVSHDLKEPVRAINNFTQFLLEDYEGKLGQEGVSHLHTLKNMASRMQELIDDLLYYSTIRKKDLTPEETDLNSTMSRILELMQLQIEENNVSVIVDKNMPSVICDKTCAEVFRNLITNAIKYNKEKLKVIEVGHTNSHARYPGKNVFFVKDNGIGIPEKHREVVFQMFKRLHGRDEYGGGTGSGLAIVKQIIDRHKGDIWIEPNEPQGSIFYFTLGKN